MINLRRPHTADAYRPASFSAPLEVDGPMLGGEGNISCGGGGIDVPGRSPAILYFLHFSGANIQFSCAAQQFRKNRLHFLRKSVILARYAPVL